MKIQRVVFVFALSFGITLALVVGQRLSTEAMAVMVGVVAGIAASVPSSLIVVWIARHALAEPPRRGLATDSRPEAAEADPKVIVVPAPAANFPAGNPYLPYRAPSPEYAPATPARQFTIIGGEATADGDRLPWR